MQHSEATIPDLSELLLPLPGDCAAGTDLDGSLELNALELASREPDEAVVGGVDVEDARDWRKLADTTQALLRRSKDLRVAAQLARSLLELHGLPGYCAGVSFVCELAERFWPVLYPALDREDGDATTRINALHELVNLPTLAQLRAARAFGVSGIGQVRVNDLLCAASSSLGRTDVERMPPHQVFAVIESLGAERLQGLVQQLRQAQERVDALTELVASQTGIYLQLELLGRPKNGKPGLFGDVVELLTHELERLASGEPGAQDVTPSTERSADRHHADRRVPGEINRREDVIAMLERVCAYYARVEPSSPVPLLIQRAKRLASMDFLEIVRDLADQGLPQVSMVTGVALDHAER